ncbi:MAG: thiamine pyrophosphate-dependent dehydrogenase E1 component subunit alpha [Acidobacteria bacterium]|nr:thiamine pyrophosphate-dependent dehydrogenase E1 component subunit alpha [Acidobacteriota bacterium]
MTVPKEKLLYMYEMMVRIRRFEEKVKELFKAGSFPGWTHVCIGEEAGAVGACSALNADDYITATHRGHGQNIAKGVPLRGIMAELMGKRDGVCRGKGGSMHIGDASVGAMGGIAILGAGTPIACGAALTAKLKGTGRVALSFFGEGASNQGVVHEAMNIAALWKLPVIFFVESNQWAELSRRSSHLCIETLALRAQGYGMPGITADGNDVLAVYEAACRAVERARKGEGPTLIDSITYRWDGHYVGDPVVLRPEGELEEWMKKCPILRLERKLREDGLLDDKRRQEIETKVDGEIAQAVEFGRQSPLPPVEDLYTNVYASPYGLR